MVKEKGIYYTDIEQLSIGNFSFIIFKNDLEKLEPYLNIEIEKRVLLKDE